MSILATMLLVDAVDKGGPGSGPQGGKSSKISGKMLPESITGSGEWGGSSLSRLTPNQLGRVAASLGIDHKPYLAIKDGPGGRRTGRNKLERAIIHVSNRKS